MQNSPTSTHRVIESRCCPGIVIYDECVDRSIESGISNPVDTITDDAWIDIDFEIKKLVEPQRPSWLALVGFEMARIYIWMTGR